MNISKVFKRWGSTFSARYNLVFPCNSDSRCLVETAFSGSAQKAAYLDGISTVLMNTNPNGIVYIFYGVCNPRKYRKDLDLMSNPRWQRRREKCQLRIFV